MKDLGKRLVQTSLLALVLAGGMMSGCTTDSKDDKPPVDTTDNDDTTGTDTLAKCLDSETELKLEITESCQLKEGNYSLKGLTFVKDGAVLTLDPGVKIMGPSNGDLSALVVQAGAKLMAVGTKAKPIVFTAGTSSPTRGDFGGVVLLGKADINLDTEEGEIEGLVGVSYGGTHDDDNSGHLEYVRIEWAGYELSTDNELNALTFGGVGSGTKISYVQAFEGRDDCFEWFGGTVSADHLVGSGCDDDIFDWDAGWRGKLQFAFGWQGEATSSNPNGIEADNLNGKESNTPVSSPMVYNITLIGNSNNALNGMHLRRGTAGHIGNAVIAGFVKGSAVLVDGNGSIKNAISGDLMGEGIYSYGNASEIAVKAASGLASNADDSASMVHDAKAAIAEWFTGEVSPLNISWASPKAGELDGAVEPPSGMANAKYIGAFDPAATELWTAGWTRTALVATQPVTKGATCLDAGNTLKLDITADCALPGDKTYSLKGLTFVKPGATLTIGAGAKVMGPENGDLSALVIMAGAKINAVGTASKPIVFTAGTSSPARGDFGGVVLLGKADINLDTEEGEIEGLVGVSYGGTDDDDSSGVMKYVRIEWAGYELSADNELNGLTFGGVGSKTQISYIQVYEGRDDCYEWFGGTVSPHHLVGTGCDDDMFDWDAGWRGKLQFAYGYQGVATSSNPNGIEADNLNGKESNTPVSSPMVYNLTLIGNNDNALNGMHLRRGTAGHIGNAIVTGFVKGSAILVDGNGSIGNVNSDDLKGEAIYAYGNTKLASVKAAAGLADSATAVASALTKVEGWFLADTSSLELTEENPVVGSSVTGAVDVPSGMVTAKYLGAFDPAASSKWTDGWTLDPR